MITIQYLEPNAETTAASTLLPRSVEPSSGQAVSPQQARTKLQAAFDRLPIDAVLLGWSLPESLVTAVRHEINETLSQTNGARRILQDLSGFPKPDRSALGKFLEFRTRTITQFITEAAALIRAEGLAVGLDCFAPSLTHMVGQDLAALSPLGDWVKVMTYAHTLGPAGLPFELLELANWLIAHGASKQQALTCLSETLRIPLPKNLDTLRNPGLSTTALQAELRRGKTITSTRSASTSPRHFSQFPSIAKCRGLSRHHPPVSTPLLAGIELIKLEGVTHLSPTQIKRDLTALRDIQVDGLSLSWDLWQMPLKYLDLVAEIFG